MQTEKREATSLKICVAVISMPFGATHSGDRRNVGIGQEKLPKTKLDIERFWIAVRRNLPSVNEFSARKFVLCVNVGRKSFTFVMKRPHQFAVFFYMYLNVNLNDNVVFRYIPHTKKR